jgi:hypothetical protein
MSEGEIPYTNFRIENLSETNDIKTRTYYKNNVAYSILNSSKTSKKLEEYRSVVFSSPENKVICFSPPRSVRFEKFKDDYYDVPEEILVNNIIEGVMINLFYDVRISSWELATKFAIGGEYNYLGESKKNSTFRDMFFECLHCDSDIKNNIFLNTLPKNYCYSFVMQHPKNSILFPVKDAKVYLVALYDIHDDNRITYIPPTVYEEWTLFRCAHIPLHFPKRYENKEFYKLKTELRSMQNSPLFLGYMLHNIETGDRCPIHNPAYHRIKKQENPQLVYQYFCIERMDKTKEFLQLFPTYLRSFSNIKNQYELFVDDVFISYINHYVEKNDETISNKILPHIQDIHKSIFLPSLSKKKIKITRKRVREYFDSMTPREVLYHINYDRRLIM